MNKRLTKDFVDFFKKCTNLRIELDNESDRGCILMATSFLDYELENIFRYYLLENKKILDEMLSGQGCLATFSSRIKLAYSLGLISKITMNDLNIIRKIRNNSGHNYKVISFNDNKIGQRVSSLKTSIYTNNKLIEPRKLFINNVFMLLVELQGIRYKLEKVQELTETFRFDLSIQEIEKQSKENLEMAKEFCGENSTKEELLKYISEVQLEALKIADRLKNGENDFNSLDE